MSRFWYWLISVWLVVFCFSCTPKHHRVTRGFYYWKTVYKPTRYELNTLHRLRATNIYLRFFDVDYDNSVQHFIPVAPVHIAAADTSFGYIPVVFITQRAQHFLNDTNIEEVAQKICAMCGQICAEGGISPRELQIDCDWTGSTRKNYFALLRSIKKQTFMAGKTLSCTLRLNQVKYLTLNGIPPADKGLVMIYGMGDLKISGDPNSILDASKAKDYLKHLERYPLPVDIALPLFEWCVLFRDGQFAGILRDVTTADVKGCPLFIRKKENIYLCNTDTAWHGYRLRANDMLRLEQSNYADIMRVAGYSAAHVRNDSLCVTLFAMDSLTLNKFSTDEMETIFDSYN